MSPVLAENPSKRPWIYFYRPKALTYYIAIDAFALLHIQSQSVVPATTESTASDHHHLMPNQYRHRSCWLGGFRIIGKPLNLLLIMRGRWTSLYSLQYYYHPRSGQRHSEPSQEDDGYCFMFTFVPALGLSRNGCTALWFLIPPHKSSPPITFYLSSPPRRWWHGNMVAEGIVSNNKFVNFLISVTYIIPYKTLNSRTVTKRGFRWRLNTFLSHQQSEIYHRKYTHRPVTTVHHPWEAIIIWYRPGCRQKRPRNQINQFP